MIEYLDCKSIADTIKSEAARKLNGGHPTLLVVRAGANSDDEMYLRGLKKDADELGISIVTDTGDPHVEPGLDGILTLGKIAYTPAVRYDVDGISGKPLRAVTQAVLMIADKYAHDKIAKGHTTVIGRGIGAQIAQELVRRDATVTLCHSKTSARLLEWTMLTSDVVICAARNAEFTTRNVSSLSVVIDISNSFDDAASHSQFKTIHMTPRKNGVGVVTRAILLDRVADNYVKRMGE